ncbi:MAG TPA: DinB family protein [Caulobacteraceae bacterium]|jgi:uncharacterized damage-inducible protein DinB|nr:DinB family protein [Caulobacteraceae bacterium]
MSTPDHYRMFASYNAWANTRLYDAAQALPDAEYRRDRKAFFGSLHRTLNHLMVGDRIWMHRFDGEGETYTQLDLVIFDDLASLRAAREAEDARIVRYTETLTPEALAHDLEYTNTQGKTFVTPLPPALDHFFNHQTHHRGQAHALISAAGAAPPPLDLLIWLREHGVMRVGETA